jgi:hypothetical protein
MNATNHNSLLIAAQDLLARGYSVLPVTTNKKPALRSWKKYQTTRATQPEIASWFSEDALDRRVTGLGVILGEVSGDLAVRDFDDPLAYATWKETHPELAIILPTVQTGRGFHVYARIPSCKTTPLGNGELRANGAYVVAPPSRHSSDVDYKWIISFQNTEIPIVDAAVFLESPTPAIHRRHEAIWRECPVSPEDPESLESHESPMHLDSPGFHDTLDAPEALDIPEVPEDLVYGKKLNRCIRDAIKASVPKGVGGRNNGIFEFARRLKAQKDLAKLDGLELRPAVEWWFEAARKIVRTKDWDTTWSDFLAGWPKVKTPFGESMEAVIEQARQEPDPECVTKCQSQETRLLIRICKVLQRRAGDAPFFLAARAAGEATGLDKDTANKRLGLLRETGILELVKKGHTGRASEYRYIGG